MAIDLPSLGNSLQGVMINHQTDLKGPTNHLSEGLINRQDFLRDSREEVLSGHSLQARQEEVMFVAVEPDRRSEQATM